MKKVLYIAAFVAVGALVQSCSYDDESTVASKVLSDIEISVDTTLTPFASNTKEGVMLYRGDVLVIDPTVTCKDNKDNDFTYEWTIPNSPFASMTQYNEPYFVIGRERKLEWTVPNDMNENSTTPYPVRLIVTDNKTQQKAMARFYVYIQENIMHGILLAYSADGKNSDLALFQDENVTTNYEINNPGVPVKKTLGLYSSANGSLCPGIIKGLNSGSWNLNGSKKITYGWTDDQLYAWKSMNYVNYKSTYDDWFYDIPSVVTPKEYIPFGSYGCLFSDGGFYLISSPSNTYPNRKLGLPSIGTVAEARSKGGVAEYDYDEHVSFAVQLAYLVFFEKNTGSFMYYAASSDFNYNLARPSMKTGAISAAGYTDWEVVQCTRNLTNNVGNRFLMRKKGTTDEFALMILDRLAVPSRFLLFNKDEVKANHMDEAVGYFIDDRDRCLHYWTSDNSIYSVYYTDTDIFTYTKEITMPSAITGMWIVKQRTRSLPSGKAFKDGAAIAIATSSSQSQGKLQIVTYKNTVDASLDFSGNYTYEVPGRISAFAIAD